MKDMVLKAAEKKSKLQITKPKFYKMKENGVMINLVDMWIWKKESKDQLEEPNRTTTIPMINHTKTKETKETSQTTTTITDQKLYSQLKFEMLN